ncbi:MAG: hypothetical protein Q4D19_00955 [Lautropia sp.]|nr:hypothetical protein [Lautropia sp.]
MPVDDDRVATLQLPAIVDEPHDSPVAALGVIVHDFDFDLVKIVVTRHTMLKRKWLRILAWLQVGLGSPVLADFRANDRQKPILFFHASSCAGNGRKVPDAAQANGPCQREKPTQSM